MNDSYSRNLPHLRSDGSTYFVTWRKHESQPDLEPTERSTVADAIMFFNGERYFVYALVVMNDHAHVVVRPTTHTLEECVHTWKSFTANKLQRAGREGAVWQREYFDRIIRDDSAFHEAIKYTIGNPRKRWPEVVEYPWAKLNLEDT